MVKYFQGISTFVYSWDQVANAFWSRYPNPYSSHVLSEDTIVRELRGDCLYTKRLLTKTNPMPKWGERFTPNTLVAIIEESYINPEDKTMVTFTHNIGYNRVMKVEEKVLYYPNPENRTETKVEREAWIESQLFGFRRAIESFGLERFRKNCDKAVKGFNHVMNSMFPVPCDSEGSHPTEASMSKLQETKGKLKEKAKLAGQLAKETATHHKCKNNNFN